MKRIVVGIIDTGLDTKCKYFLRTNYEACSVKQDGNVSLLKSDYEDKNGHGTACASIIINECPNVEFFIINAFGESGKTNLVAIEKALKILKETSVDIINMSFAITTAPGNELISSLTCVGIPISSVCINDITVDCHFTQIGSHVLSL